MATTYLQNISGTRIDFIKSELNILVSNEKLSTETANHIINQFHDSAPNSPEREIAEFNFSNAVRYS